MAMENNYLPGIAILAILSTLQARETDFTDQALNSR